MAGAYKLQMTKKDTLLKFIFILSLLIYGVLAPGRAAADSTDVPVGQCRAFFNNGGYLFDDYEQHEYVNGFLRLHLKLKDQYNDGRGWFDKFFLFKPNCVASSYTTN